MVPLRHPDLLRHLRSVLLRRGERLRQFPPRGDAADGILPECFPHGYIRTQGLAHRVPVHCVSEPRHGGKPSPSLRVAEACFVQRTYRRVSHWRRDKRQVRSSMDHVLRMLDRHPRNGHCGRQQVPGGICRRSFRPWAGYHGLDLGGSGVCHGDLPAALAWSRNGYV
jgi:hypothetical protein